MSIKELLTLDEFIEEMNEKKAEAEALLEEVEALKSLVKEHMVAFNLDELQTPQHHITFSKCERTNINKKTLQSEYPEIFGKVAKISSYMMLRIN